MIGDQSDMLGRLKAVLPTRWFADDTPVLDSILSGVSAGWAWVYQLLQYVRIQTRIASATGVWLDTISLDLFGNRVIRRSGQGDGPFRVRIQQEIFREHGTRAAITSILEDLTARTPAIFEPARVTDTGGYGSVGGDGTGFAYGLAGAWGNLELPFQCCVTAYRGVAGAIADVNGYGDNCGGYGVGASEYASLTMIQGPVTDADICAAVARVMPVAAIAWLAIADGPVALAQPGMVVGLSTSWPTLNSVGLTWDAPSHGGAVAAYTVLRRTAGATQWTIAASGVIPASVAVSGLMPGTAYEFDVVATNAAGPGPTSRYVSAKTFSTAIGWGFMPPAGTYLHSSGGIPVNVTTAPNPPGINFGWSLSNLTLPTAVTAGGLFNGNYWGDYLNAPAVAGTYYLWVLASDGSGQLISGPIVIN
jgi:hypothetical protein